MMLFIDHTTHDRIFATSEKYKTAADKKFQEFHFQVGDFFWAVLTDDLILAHEILQPNPHMKYSMRILGSLYDLKTNFIADFHKPAPFFFFFFCWKDPLYF